MISFMGMKRFWLLLLLCSWFHIHSFAQNRQLQKTDSVLTLVKQNFALKNANALYALTGDKFRAALSQLTFQQVCAQQLFPLGNIKTSTLISFQNNSLATYKLQFEAVTLQFLLSLDQFDKIEVFLFQPYKDNSIKKLANAATDNKLATIADRKIDTAAREYIQKVNTVG